MAFSIEHVRRSASRAALDSAHREREAGRARIAELEAALREKP